VADSRAAESVAGKRDACATTSTSNVSRTGARAASLVRWGDYDVWRQGSGKRRPQEKGRRAQAVQNLRSGGVRPNRRPRHEPRLRAPVPGIARQPARRATEQGRTPEWRAADCAVRGVKEATSLEEQRLRLAEQSNRRWAVALRTAGDGATFERRKK